MKITWTADVREVTGYGILQEGGTYNLPKDVSENLIKQGLAEKAKPKKKERD